MHSDALRGTQRHSEAIRGNQLTKLMHCLKEVGDLFHSVREQLELAKDEPLVESQWSHRRGVGVCTAYRRAASGLEAFLTDLAYLMREVIN